MKCIQGIIWTSDHILMLAGNNLPHISRVPPINVNRLTVFVPENALPSNCIVFCRLLIFRTSAYTRLCSRASTHLFTA